MIGFETGLGRKSEAVLQQLRDDLDSGRFAPGTRLPPEDELCVRFKASRGTIRRATARLVAEGRIRTGRGSGTYVCDVGTTTRQSRTISVMFPFDGRSLSQVQRRVLELGYLLSVFTQRDGWDPKAERQFLQRVRAERHAALLAFCTPIEPRNDDLLEQLVRAGTRVIHVEHYRLEPPSQSYLLPDYRLAGLRGAEALMAAGYPDLCFVALRSDGPFVTLLRDGFAQAIADRRGKADHAFFNMPPGIPEQTASLRQGLVAFLQSQRRPIGLLCRSSGFANAVLMAARDAGKRVPEDVGIIGVTQLLGYHPVDSLTDMVDFDWSALVHEALNEATRRQQRRVRRLFAPTLIRKGTTRHG